MIEQLEIKKKYAFTTSKRKNIDYVEVLLNNEMTLLPVPATPRTINWAILKYMYLNHSKKVSPHQLFLGVKEIMEEENIEKWEKFQSKKEILYTDKSGIQEKKTIKSEEDRICTNAKNLCRLSGSTQYSNRLIPLGHIMRCLTDDDRHTYFIMHMNINSENINPYKRGRKKKKVAYPTPF